MLLIHASVYFRNQSYIRHSTLGCQLGKQADSESKTDLLPSLSSFLSLFTQSLLSFRFLSYSHAVLHFITHPLHFPLFVSIIYCTFFSLVSTFTFVFKFYSNNILRCSLFFTFFPFSLSIKNPLTLYFCLLPAGVNIHFLSVLSPTCCSNQNLSPIFHLCTKIKFKQKGRE